MTYLSGLREISRHDRLFQPIRQLLTLTACVGVSYQAALGSAAPNLDHSIFPSQQFNLTVVVPQTLVMEAAVLDEKPSSISILFEKGDGQSLVQHLHAQGRTTILFDILMMAIGVTFVDFYESHKGWLRGPNGLPSDVTQWPTVLNFGRAVRNFISHSGKVFFEKPSTPPVHWHHVEYCYKDQGRRIIGPELQYPELLILLIEMSDELDRLGCPVSE